MKKLLFITTEYYPKASPNGVCIHEVARVLKTMGYEISVLCPQRKNESKQECIDDVNIFRIKKPLFLRLMEYAESSERRSLFDSIIYKVSIILQYIHLLFFLPVYPITSVSYILRYYIFNLKLYKQYKYDGVISTYNSIEAVLSGMLLKRINPSLKFCLYVLDSLSNRGAGKFLSKKYVDRKGWFWEKRLYKYADKILNVKCHENHHMQERYSPYREKMEIVDFPLLKDTEQIVFATDNNLKNHDVNIVYTGSLQSSFRNPKYACEVFALLNKSEYKVNFYSRGDSEQILLKYEHSTGGIITRKGFIEREKSLNVINNAQILLSIGNANTDMVPSKIFEYMATGKPIIHFYCNDDDSCKQYYDKYPLALLIKEDYSRIKDNSGKVAGFIADVLGKTLDYKEVESMFPLNTPIYTARIISEIINK